MSQKRLKNVSISKESPAHAAVLSEEELMARAQAGDLPAFEELALRLQPRLYSFIFRYVRHKETAQDLVQETLLRVFKYRANYKTGRRLSTWVFTLALNLCRDHHRRVHPTSSLDEPLVEVWAEKNLPASHGAGPEMEAEKREIARLVLDALSELPPLVQRLLYLNHEEDLTLESAGKKLGLSADAARALASRAYRKLREKLSGKLNRPPKKQE